MNFKDVNDMMRHKFARELESEIVQIRRRVAEAFAPIHEMLPKESSSYMKVGLAESQDQIAGAIIKDLIDAHMHKASIKLVEQYDLREVYADSRD